MQVEVLSVFENIVICNITCEVSFRDYDFEYCGFRRLFLDHLKNLTVDVFTA